ncbi:MAG: Uma2 family endonuclease [Gemmataceae bacterium]|nr:Uma2 family endonuclease [Gemmataceae bacterium]
MSSLPVPRAPSVPPLIHGERLTRDEFERRYDAMPGVKKAELIEGVVHMPSPVHWVGHGSPHASLIWFLVNYSLATPGTQVGDNATARMGTASAPQPDGSMIILPSHGGRTRISEDDYLEGGPELATGASASSAPLDLGEKFRLYQRTGVQEYLVWRVPDGEVDWFALRRRRYQRLAPQPDGTIRSVVFPGLWLAVPALVAGDLAGVLATLQAGLASPEHAAFLAQLQAARR